MVTMLGLKLWFFLLKKRKTGLYYICIVEIIMNWVKVAVGKALYYSQS